MSDQFLGEIRIFGFDYAPTGWAACNGQLVPLSQNTALFSLLGTTYGGNGTTTFALPNLQGMVPVGFGQGAGLSPYALGQSGGETAHALLVSELPAHAHGALAHTGRGSAAVQTPAGGSALSISQGADAYVAGQGAAATMAPAQLAPAGAGQPHDNLMPTLGFTICIALQGTFPARS